MYVENKTTNKTTQASSCGRLSSGVFFFHAKHPWTSSMH